MTPLQEDTRFRVLRALMDKGAIKIRNFRGNTRKLSDAYILTPNGLAEKTAFTARFLARKQKEYESLKAEIEAVSREFEQETLPATDACTDSGPMAATPMPRTNPQ
jgi:hypothetical protein